MAAIWLLHEVKKEIDRWGLVSVADVHGIANRITCDDYKSNFTDNKYGWTIEDDLYIIPYREPHWGYSVYGLELPEPKLI